MSGTVMKLEMWVVLTRHLNRIVEDGPLSGHNPTAVPTTCAVNLALLCLCRMKRI